jgi:hypothetical protein
MSPKPFKPFKRSKKSPFDHDGPNQKALKDAINWIESSNSPFSRRIHEVPKPAPHREEEPPNQSDESVEPATQVSVEAATPESESAETELAEPPSAEKEIEQEVQAPETIEAKPNEPADAPQVPIPESEAPDSHRSEPAASEPESGAADLTQIDLAETDIVEAELANLQEISIEEAQMRAGQNTPRNPLLDARRFPRHYTPTPIDRHERLCAICHHQDREAIEQAFLQWRRTTDIRYEFSLPSRTTIYRHAHAMGLFEKRAQSVRFVLENVMEESSACESTGDTMVRAVRAYSCLDRSGRWVEPPRRVIIARELLPAKPAKSRAKSRPQRGNRRRVTPAKRKANKSPFERA